MWKFALIHILLPDGNFLRCLIIEVTVTFQTILGLGQNCHPISPAQLHCHPFHQPRHIPGTVTLKNICSRMVLGMGAKAYDSFKFSLILHLIKYVE